MAIQFPKDIKYSNLKAIEMDELEKLLQAIKEFATLKINEYPNNVIYHDIKFAQRYQEHVDTVAMCDGLDEETVLLGKISAWIISASYDDIKVKLKKGELPTSNRIERSMSVLEEFSEKHDIPFRFKSRIKTSIPQVFHPNKPNSILSKLLFDSMFMDLVVGKSKKKLERLYEELLLNDVTLSKRKWNDIAIGIIKEVTFQLPSCHKEMQPKLNLLIRDIEKDQKKIKKQSDFALRKEFDIGEKELKNFKKRLENSKGRDDRGIQTMFRTTSRNHYTLNEMVDKKANIMITVNSIILSLILGGLIGQVNDHGHLHFDSQNVPIILLTITSMLSIIFAILSIRPGVTHGHFTEEEIRKKEGNLLYYGNFHDMTLKDYEWGFMAMMNDQQFLYSSMIKDLYFLGKLLQRKYRQIRISLTIFLIGLTLSVVSFMVLRFLLHI